MLLFPELGGLCSTATHKTSPASRLEEPLPVGPGNLPSISRVWFWELRSSLRSAPIQETSMTRSVPHSRYFPTRCPRSAQTPISSPELNREVVRALLGLWGKRRPKEEWAVPSPISPGAPWTRKARGLWRRVLSFEFSTSTPCVRVWEGVSGFWDSGHPCPEWSAGVSSPGRVIRHCCTHGSRSSWCISIYIYHF